MVKWLYDGPDPNQAWTRPTRLEDGLPALPNSVSTPGSPVLTQMIFEWWRRWNMRRRVRKYCFHHDLRTGQSYIKSRLIETGKAKMFWCTACDRTWFA